MPFLLAWKWLLHGPGTNASCKTFKAPVVLFPQVYFNSEMFLCNVVTAIVSYILFVCVPFFLIVLKSSLCVVCVL